MAMADLLAGFAFFLIIEGLVYALAPRFLGEMARLIPSIPPEHLRLAGLISLTLGVGLVWLVRG